MFNLDSPENVDYDFKKDIEDILKQLDELVNSRSSMARAPEHPSFSSSPSLEHSWRAATWDGTRPHRPLQLVRMGGESRRPTISVQPQRV